mgnify:CR=1 FL=1
MVKTQNYIWKSDRSLAVNEFDDQLYYYVAEHNDLITKARHDLTARELKIMEYMDIGLSKIEESEKIDLNKEKSRDDYDLEL